MEDFKLCPFCEGTGELDLIEKLIKYISDNHEHNENNEGRPYVDSLALEADLKEIRDRLSGGKFEGPEWYNKKTLEATLQKCIRHGVRYFTLFNIDEDFEDWDGVSIEWHWDVYDTIPHKGFRIPKPWRLRVRWVGFNRRIPFRFYFDDGWYFWYSAPSNQGCQGNGKDTLEEGLSAALGTYLCESKGKECEVTSCEYYNECKEED